MPPNRTCPSCRAPCTTRLLKKSKGTHLEFKMLPNPASGNAKETAKAVVAYPRPQRKRSPGALRPPRKRGRRPVPLTPAQRANDSPKRHHKKKVAQKPPPNAQLLQPKIQTIQKINPSKPQPKPHFPPNPLRIPKSEGVGRHCSRIIQPKRLEGIPTPVHGLSYSLVAAANSAALICS